MNMTACAQAGRTAYHGRLFRESYDKSLKEFSEGGIEIGEGYRKQKISAEDFLKKYNLSVKNIFRVVDLSINTETDAKYTAAKDIITFNRVKKNLEALS